MSRNNKSGLDYFPLDVDIFNDEKIELLSAKCGLISELIIIKLFAKIYHNSYFIKWDDDVAYLFAKKNCDGIQKEKIDEIVKESIRINIFNQELFGIYSILTSKCIQNIYLEATKRRNKIDIIKQYLLLDEENVNIINKNVNIIELNVNINSQSKVKESKGKKKEYVQKFDEFYSLYPKKHAKQSAIKAWMKLKPDDELFDKIMAGLTLSIKSAQWNEEKGKYIPLPATWINGKRWEDSHEEPTKSKDDGWY